MERRYSNIESEALHILHDLKRFHHYCFAREVSIITDHKPILAIFKKDVATLLQRKQQIFLRIHQFRVKILFKPGLDVFLGDGLSMHNHKGNKYTEIPGMKVKVDTIQTAANIPECLSIQQLQLVTSQDDHL